MRMFRFNLFLDRNQRDKLDQIHRETGVSRSDLVRQCLDAYLDSLDQRPKSNYPPELYRAWLNGLITRDDFIRGMQEYGNKKEAGEETGQNQSQV
jgi:hypothetical protein